MLHAPSSRCTMVHPWMHGPDRHATDRPTPQTNLSRRPRARSRPPACLSNAQSHVSHLSSQSSRLTRSRPTSAVYLDPAPARFLLCIAPYDLWVWHGYGLI